MTRFVHSKELQEHCIHRLRFSKSQIKDILKLMTTIEKKKIPLMTTTLKIFQKTYEKSHNIVL